MLDWDPLQNSASEPAVTPQCSYRLKRDIMSLCSDPLQGIIIEPDESQFLRLHALFTGAPGTPYANGFFYFILGFPPNYPFSPPKVRFMTTGAGRVRFNPNLYSSGKVCLSILGTYPGPEWSAAQGVRSVLLSIQSLLNEKPYCNEPGYEKERKPGDIQRYNAMLIHETIRVAVLGMVENESGLTMPEKFSIYRREAFRQHYSFYEKTILDNIILTGQPIADPLYNHKYGNFEYDRLLDRLEYVRSQIIPSQP